MKSELNRQKLRKIGIAALPVVLFLIIYCWWNPFLTRSDRRLRKRLSNVVEVRVQWQTWSRTADTDGSHMLTPNDTELLRLKGKELHYFISQIHVKDVNLYPGWGYSKNFPRPFNGKVTSPHVYLLFIMSDQDNFTLDVYRGWFVITTSGISPLGPWEGNGAPLQESTKTYLKKLLKPYDIPDEVIDGKEK